MKRYHKVINHINHFGSKVDSVLKRRDWKLWLSDWVTVLQICAVNTSGILSIKWLNIMTYCKNANSMKVLGLNAQVSWGFSVWRCMFSLCPHGFSWVLLFYQRHARLFVLPSPLSIITKLTWKLIMSAHHHSSLGLVGVCMECSLLLALC